ncbi:hypothetical protein RJ639_031736 [Escallonia herrerae]|uniref:Methyltransferase-like protein 13 n=1 Tax=Escallonia herrerae TaxID=1293975 RepID=A0AA89BAN2_9ASTE|nr:hypothetical protein RJ639_031736 [Escallonia herrerae]
MAFHPVTFETLVPSRYITFTLPDPSASPHLRTAPLLRVAVLDSPIQPTTPRVAAILVPTNRETDWIFSTEPGHLQLLLTSPQTSRLILLGDLPSSPNPTPSFTRPCSADSTDRQHKLTPLLIALSPRSCFAKGLPKILFLDYEDDVVNSVIVDRRTGPIVGELLVEDVEIEGDDGVREFRRRLRFKRMPNFIQSQIRILPNGNCGGDDDCSGRRDFGGSVGVGFRLDTGVLVHPYLEPMVAGVSLIGSYLDEQIRGGLRPKALCLGVGGGALIEFLSEKLGFEVVGVEADEVVLRVAKQHFGLKDRESTRLCVCDGIAMMIDGFDTKFDIIMVDLDSSDARTGISAPPLEFVGESVLRAASLVLRDQGILVINVIPPSQSFYEVLIHELREVFNELYEINVGNMDNFVLVGTVSPIKPAINECENSFLKKLKSGIAESYMEYIRKI